MTNFEKIKENNIEEMAEFLNSATGQIALRLNGEYVSNDKVSLRLWLKSEVEKMNLSFSFGALCPKFSTQLKQQGYELKNKETWDRAVLSVVYLHIHDILTDSRYDECLNRIVKKSKVDWLKSEARE